MKRGERKLPAVSPRKFGLRLAVLVAAAIVFFLLAHAMTGPTRPKVQLAEVSQKSEAPKPKPAAKKTTVKPVKTTPAPTTTATETSPPPTPHSCAQNTLSKNVIVSISARHMWACDRTATEYDSPVITGMEYLAADLTPTGTYHVFAKYTNRTLRGCDGTGCWNDFVNYWMPWLHNQYGNYGFHDATWRKNSDFGNISPYSHSKNKDKVPSHGCVELPLAAAKWLYGWAPIGTTVTIVS